MLVSTSREFGLMVSWVNSNI